MWHPFQDGAKAMVQQRLAESAAMTPSRAQREPQSQMRAVAARSRRRHWRMATLSESPRTPQRTWNPRWTSQTSLRSSEADELGDTYKDTPAQHDIASEDQDLQLLEAAAPGGGLEDETVAAVQQAMVEAGLSGEDGAEGASSSAAPPPAAEGPPPEEVVMAPPQPWDNFIGPSASGYVHDAGRAVLRIQRGKPANRVTLSCYKHPGCTLLVNENRAPDNLEIFKWFVEVESPHGDMSTAEKRALTARHKALARAKWTAPR